jgi:hypothetical protein
MSNNDGFDEVMRDNFPRRNDNKEAARWRGPLFEDFSCELIWNDPLKGCTSLEPPRSVTFPICQFCGHVIWDWPHFEEPVPDGAVCTTCAEEDERRERCGG